MNIRLSKLSDLDALMPIFDEARRTIATLGIDQWQNGYPTSNVIEADIHKNQSYCVEIDDTICATFALIDDGEPTYDRIYDGHWLTGDDSHSYVAVHRVAISVSHRGRGIAPAVIDYVADVARQLGRKSIRIDTHRGNAVMRRMLEKNGFCCCGVILLSDGAERVAYEKVIK